MVGTLADPPRFARSPADPGGARGRRRRRDAPEVRRQVRDVGDARPDLQTSAPRPRGVDRSPPEAGRRGARCGLRQRDAGQGDHGRPGVPRGRPGPGAGAVPPGGRADRGDPVRRDRLPARRRVGRRRDRRRRAAPRARARPSGVGVRPRRVAAPDRQGPPGQGAARPAADQPARLGRERAVRRAVSLPVQLARGVGRLPRPPRHGAGDRAEEDEGLPPARRAGAGGFAALLRGAGAHVARSAPADDGADHDPGDEF
jgi:hypothetical protein